MRTHTPTGAAVAVHEEMHTDLTALENSLLGIGNPTSGLRVFLEIGKTHLCLPSDSVRHALRLLQGKGLRRIIRDAKRGKAYYEEGRGWPPNGTTMIGRARLRNIRACIEEVVRNGIPGDFIEAGVWRGGAAMYMKAVLRKLHCNNRTVWLADSFRGLPPPGAHSSEDAGCNLHTYPFLRVSRKEVEDNFRAYGLLDEHVRFIESWFSTSLDPSPVREIAVARIDCDMYSSTTSALEGLYPRISPGGFVIIDDYGDLPACKKAVDDFRKHNDICEKIHPVDHTCIFWQKTA